MIEFQTQGQLLNRSRLVVGVRLDGAGSVPLVSLKLSP